MIMDYFSNKKGSVEGFQLGPVLILFFIALVTVILFSFANSWGDSTYFKRVFTAKDLGFTIDALQFSKGDIEIEYPQTIEGMKLSFESKRIVVTSLYYSEIIETTAFDIIDVKGLKIVPSNHPEELLDKEGKAVKIIIYDINIKKENNVISVDDNNE